MFKKLLKDTWQILNRPRPNIWLLFFVLPLLAIIPFDASTSGLRFPEDSQAQQVARFISQRGDFYNSCLALIGILFVAGLALKKKALQRLALAMLLSCAVAGVLALAVRVISGRPRPQLAVADGLYGPRLKLHKGNFLFLDYDYQSFPSGHTTTAIATAMPVAFVAPAVGVPLLVAAGGVMWSRFQLQRHHLSDLYMGFVFGGIFGAAFGLAVKNESSKKKC